MSMDYRVGGTTLFEQAQQQAKATDRGSSPGRRLDAHPLADPPRVVIPEPAFDAADVMREIDSLRVRHTGADLTRTLEQTEEIIRQARRRHPAPDRHARRHLLRSRPDDLG
jgi:hypothetical protein